ncbi:mucin-like protein, partial [Achlya hypogyna]
PAYPTPSPSSPSTGVPLPSTNEVPAGCTQVSVVGDATYCIKGPVCSGAGVLPAGSNCPKKGDVAVADCLKALKSYVDAGKCVAPVDAICQKIPSGAYGCVFPTTPAATIVSSYTPTPAVSVPTPTPAASVPSPTPARSTPGYRALRA